MPRTALTVTQSLRTGVAQPAQNNSDVVNQNVLPANDGRIVLEVQNTNAASRTVTIAVPGTVDGLTVGTAGARVVTVNGVSTAYIGPFPPAIYNQPDGSVSIDSSGAGGDLKYRAIQVL